MKKLALVVAFVVMSLPSVAFGDGRCTLDGIGGITCYDSYDGNTFRGSVDDGGYLSGYDSEGTRYWSAPPDFLGTRIVRDSNGNTMRCVDDGFGTTRCSEY